ncbi:hypothetical protein [Methylobacterium isbiliense]|nr:hypothetical protein [Methylobacterium isbiliense]MBY0296765.1 hypothetical protein [Methylobacterium sp.]MDN3625729.1 hypothetical protein [Methylobacterium isbiliense]
MESRHVGKPQPHRKIVTGRRDCITGEYPSGKQSMNYRQVAYEGRLARDFIVLIDNDPRVISYREEPPPFPWFDGDKWRSYTPDFDCLLDDGKRQCHEIKPWKLRQRLHPRFKEGVGLGALEAGYDSFEIWTEREIDPLAVANAALISSERGFSVADDELHTIRLAVDRANGPTSVADLRQRSGIGLRSFRAVVSLIARGELVQLDPKAPLDDRAIVGIPTTMNAR